MISLMVEIDLVSKNGEKEEGIDFITIACWNAKERLIMHSVLDYGGRRNEYEGPAIAIEFRRAERKEKDIDT